MRVWISSAPLEIEALFDPPKVIAYWLLSRDTAETGAEVPRMFCYCNLFVNFYSRCPLQPLASLQTMMPPILFYSPSFKASAFFAYHDPAISCLFLKNCSVVISVVL